MVITVGDLVDPAPVAVAQELLAGELLERPRTPRRVDEEEAIRLLCGELISVDLGTPMYLNPMDFYHYYTDEPDFEINSLFSLNQGFFSVLKMPAASLAGKSLSMTPSRTPYTMAECLSAPFVELRLSRARHQAALSTAASPTRRRQASAGVRLPTSFTPQAPLSRMRSHKSERTTAPPSSAGTRRPKELPTPPHRGVME